MAKWHSKSYVSQSTYYRTMTPLHIIPQLQGEHFLHRRVPSHIYSALSSGFISTYIVHAGSGSGKAGGPGQAAAQEDLLQ